jgi:hypothetical protein
MVLARLLYERCDGKKDEGQDEDEEGSVRMIRMRMRRGRCKELEARSEVRG